MKISLIAAVAKNNVIGYKNALPWHISLDLKHFQKITLGHCVVMGQTTFESIGKPLPKRTVIVLSDNPDFSARGCNIARSLKEAFDLARKKGEKELMIAGGASVYKQTIEKADRIYLTKINHEFKGDTFFPKIRKSDWKVVSKRSFKKGGSTPYNFDFLTMERKR